jgi:SOS-response transcriptional repressor LexA
MPLAAQSPQPPRTADEQCLDFIRDFVAEHHYPPTVRQIADYMGVTAAPMHGRLKRLEREGRLVARRNGPRTMTLEVIGDESMNLTRAVSSTAPEGPRGSGSAAGE